jgi:uncharacterized iron-regulated membrane protein
MNTWDKWVKRPQTIWFRRLLFQVHLWSGIGLGAYVLVVCLSGSAAVFNNELYVMFLPAPKMVEVTGPPLSRTELKAAAQLAHPHATITRVNIWQDPREAAVVSLGAATYADQRYVNPYTGQDLGTARPLGLRTVSFISSLHMNLLMGYSGRLINGVGGFLVAILSVTGMVIWWPGIRRWRSSLTVRRNANPKRLNWDLHNTIGFWTFAIVFMWAITGAYLVLPQPFDKVLSFIPSAAHFINIGILRGVHVGNFGGWPVKMLWLVLGLAPPVLFITGFIMWWHRVLSPWMRNPSAARSRAISAGYSAPRQTFEPDGI